MVGMATTFFSRYFLFHVMASRFLSSSEDEIRQLLEKKDSKNTKRTYKVAQQLFHEYLLENGIAEPTEKSEIARVLRRFYSNKSILSLPCLFSPLTMYNKTIIGFGYCDMQNYQCLRKSYLPRLRLG